MKTQLKKGVMDLLVLSLLMKKDRYGYDIVSSISDFVEISEGTIYPLCNRLKSERYVETYLQESTSGPSRKYYRITEEGRGAYERMLAEWKSFAHMVDQLLDGDDGKEGTERHD